jgi:hypothetical protein
MSIRDTLVNQGCTAAVREALIMLSAQISAEAIIRAKGDTDEALLITHELAAEISARILREAQLCIDAVRTDPGGQHFLHELIAAIGAPQRRESA